MGPGPTAQRRNLSRKEVLFHTPSLYIRSQAMQQMQSIVYFVYLLIYCHLFCIWQWDIDSRSFSVAFLGGYVEKKIDYLGLYLSIPGKTLPDYGLPGLKYLGIKVLEYIASDIQAIEYIRFP